MILFKMNSKKYKYRCANGFFAYSGRHQQAGLSLIELLVGMAIGLLVVSVALVALMTSRGVSGTVSDATHLQQEAAYVVRVIGQQARQAGSLELNLVDDSPATKVSFDTKNLFDRANSTVAGAGTASDPILDLSYQSTKETIFKLSPSNPGDTESGHQLRTCLGNLPSGGSNVLQIKNKISYKRATKELICDDGTGSGAQAISGNVADFRVRYLLQTRTASSVYAIQSVETVPAGRWKDVYGVEICIDLQGQDRVDTAGGTYINCEGNSVDLDNAIHLVTRTVFQLRSQG